jgi:ribosomal protein L29
MQQEKIAGVGNSELNEKLLELKNELYNATAAAKARQLAVDADIARVPFDASEYEKHLEHYPSFSYLHLVTPSDE